MDIAALLICPEQGWSLGSLLKSNTLACQVRGSLFPLSFSHIFLFSTSLSFYFLSIIICPFFFASMSLPPILCYLFCILFLVSPLLTLFSFLVFPLAPPFFIPPSFYLRSTSSTLLATISVLFPSFCSSPLPVYILVFSNYWGYESFKLRS